MRGFNNWDDSDASASRFDALSRRARLIKNNNAGRLGLSLLTGAMLTGAGVALYQDSDHNKRANAELAERALGDHDLDK